MDLIKIRKIVDEKKAALEFLKREKQSETLNLEKETENLSDTEEAQAILQGVAARLQQKAQEKISKIVTQCLGIVFDDPYEFNIIFEEKRGKTEARLVFIKNGEEYEPLLSSGGGVIDVAAFALRLASLIYTRPACRKVLILDEPFKHLSKQYRPAVKNLLLHLSHEYNIQIIMVTHDPVLEIGKVIEVGVDND